MSNIIIATCKQQRDELKYTRVNDSTSGSRLPTSAGLVNVIYGYLEKLLLNQG